MAAETITLRGVSWETYELLVADHDDQRAPRFTYDRGELEIVSPHFEHERASHALVMLVEVVVEVLKLDAVAAGTMTVRREDMRRGFQPDASFYIEHAADVRGKSVIDVRIDPPPDLVIEIDVTHSSLNKVPIYAEFGIPEVWQYRDGNVSILVREGAGYREVSKSLVLPIVTDEAHTRFVREDVTRTRFVWLRSLRRWARQQARSEQSTP